MNFEAISRFNFKTIEKAQRNTEESIRMTENKVSMTRALFERMGNPEWLSFGYDDEERALGVRISDEKDPNAVKVLYYKKSVTNITHSAFVANKIRGVMGAKDDQVVVLKRGAKVNEWYVFQLRYAEVQKKCGRRKSDEL